MNIVKLCILQILYMKALQGGLNQPPLLNSKCNDALERYLVIDEQKVEFFNFANLIDERGEIIILKKGKRSAFYNYVPVMVNTMPKNELNILGVNALDQLQNVNGVLKMVACGSDSSYIYLITKLHSRNLLSKSPIFRTDTTKLKKYLKLFSDLVETIETIHSKGIILRNLKPGNLLIDENEERIYISEFESASSATEGVKAGSQFYMSPENEEDDEHKSTNKDDIYMITFSIVEITLGSEFTKENLAKCKKEIDDNFKFKMSKFPEECLTRFVDKIESSLVGNKSSIPVAICGENSMKSFCTAIKGGLHFSPNRRSSINQLANSIKNVSDTCESSDIKFATESLRISQNIFPIKSRTNSIQSETASTDSTKTIGNNLSGIVTKENTSFVVNDPLENMSNGYSHDINFRPEQFTNELKNKKNTESIIRGTGISNHREEYYKIQNPPTTFNHHSSERSNKELFNKNPQKSKDQNILGQIPLSESKFYEKGPTNNGVHWQNKDMLLRGGKHNEGYFTGTKKIHLDTNVIIDEEKYRRNIGNYNPIVGNRIGNTGEHQIAQNAHFSYKPIDDPNNRYNPVTIIHQSPESLYRQQYIPAYPSRFTNPLSEYRQPKIAQLLI
jgi:serine/threonine protein kinase